MQALRASYTGVFIGFESLSDDNLLDAHEKTPKTADYARRVRMLSSIRMRVNGSFVLGFDHDRRDCFRETARGMVENRLECSTLHGYTPYPATPLFPRSKLKARSLAPRDWSLYDTSHAVFPPERHERRGTKISLRWSTSDCSRTPAMWRRRPEELGRRFRFISRCRISTSARTGSGTC